MATQLRFKLPTPKRRGRPRKPEKDRKVSHSTRLELNGRHPVHVTLKLADELPSLRRKDVFKALRAAVAVARGKGFAVVHFSILSNHLHFLLEPEDRKTLARAIQSLSISLARKVNRIAQRRGRVFDDRYDVKVLATPTQTRNALAYVLSNESKHRGSGLGKFFISEFSSGFAFNEWPWLFGRKYRVEPSTGWSLDEIETWLAEILAPARTWLLATGWRRAGPVQGAG